MKGYAAHEQRVLQQITESRARATAADGRVRVFALAESNPDLKADAHFLELRRELLNTENRIQAARRFYNANLRDLNNRVEMFPSSLVAGMVSIGRAEFFEVDHLSIREVPAVSLQAYGDGSSKRTRTKRRCAASGRGTVTRRRSVGP